MSIILMYVIVCADVCTLENLLIGWLDREIDGKHGIWLEFLWRSAGLSHQKYQICHQISVTEDIVDVPI